MPSMPCSVLHLYKCSESASVMVQGFIGVHGKGSSHICDGAVNAECSIWVLNQHTRPFRQWLLGCFHLVTQASAHFPCEHFNMFRKGSEHKLRTLISSNMHHMLVFVCL